MTLNAKSKTLFTIVYIMVYPCLIMFTTHLSLRGYTQGAISSIISICTIITIAIKPLISLVFDKGHCHSCFGFLLLSMVSGSVLFYCCTETSFILALVYGMLCFCFCGSLTDIADCWVGKLAMIDKTIDYGKCRSCGSLSFALTSVIYGITFNVVGLIQFPIMLTVLSIIAFIVILGLPQIKDDNRNETHGSAFKSVFNWHFMAIVFAFAFAMCAVNLSDNYAGLVFLEKGGNTVHIGFYDFLRCIVETLVMINASRLFEKFGIIPVALVGMAGLIIKPLALSFSPNAVVAVISSVTHGLGFPLIMNSKMKIISSKVEKEHLAFALSTVGITASLLYSLAINPLMSYISEQTSVSFGLALTASTALIGMAILYFSQRKELRKR